ncbi:diguanylate cyclase [Methylomonas sp. LL1]|uniref:diguanylate cyclase n=1 Tax=Methylomonas sp. LL1 TaxID=2785785 RepID=UPI0018C38100|nr:diguanylate cyclase [Methylomonas sp. LL1]QPK61864.1 diguanylate cyclase [Methylomonas sp. LL1]
MFKLDEAKLQAVLKQLHQAIYNHERWHNDLIRTIICQQPHDHHDMAKDAHRRCRFGQWYYNDVPTEVRDHQAFLAIRTEHKHMHQLATQLLATAATKAAIAPHDYDAFANALDRLRLEIQTLSREIEESLYNHDPLTGALNRIGMLTSLRALHELVKRQVQQCCIAIMDLDHFKVINDSYGHAVGDKVLSASVRYLMDHLRPYDKVFRYGGEEFLISLPSTDLKAGHTMIERIREELGKPPLAFHGSKPIPLTVSFGLAMLDPEVNVEETIRRADKALYAAKSAGRNCSRKWDAVNSTPLA